MDEFIGELNQMDLFLNIKPEEIKGLLVCLCARRVNFAKGDCIIEEGNRVYDFGIILSGHGRAVKWDPSGREIIISLLEKGSETGVMLAASPDNKSPVTVQAQDDVSVMQIPVERVLTRCKKACPRHDRLLRNFIGIIAEKGLILHERIDCLLRSSIREKILAYLWKVSRERQNRTFCIPMDRNSMAEYLNVERSALSRELSCMKRDGIIDYHKNMFQLL